MKISKTTLVALLIGAVILIVVLGLLAWYYMKREKECKEAPADCNQCVNPEPNPPSTGMPVYTFDTIESLYGLSFKNSEYEPLGNTVNTYLSILPENEQDNDNFTFTYRVESFNPDGEPTKPIEATYVIPNSKMDLSLADKGVIQGKQTDKNRMWFLIFKDRPNKETENGPKNLLFLEFMDVTKDESGNIQQDLMISEKYTKAY